MKKIVRVVINFLRKISDWAEEKHEEEKVYEEFEEELEEIHSIWDYLSFKENTQAAHLSIVIGFEEWVSMKEIMRRIKELFGAEYKNERSLYPYIKTLVDVGLFETSNVGGVMKWRKKDLIIKVKEEKKEEKKELTKEKVVKKKEIK